MNQEAQKHHPIAELETTLQELLEQSKLQTEALSEALKKVKELKGPTITPSPPHLEKASSPSKTIDNAEDVAEAAEELRSLERISELLDVVELDTALEHSGSLIAKTRADVEQLDILARQIQADGIFEDLTVLYPLDRSLLPRSWWGKKPQDQFKFLGLLMPDTTADRERKTFHVIYNARIFLLSDKGNVLVLNGEIEDPLGMMRAEKIITLAELQPYQNPSYLKFRPRAPLANAMPEDFQFEAPQKVHPTLPRSVKHPASLRSASGEILDRLKRAIQISIEQHQENIKQRIQAVTEIRSQLRTAP